MVRRTALARRWLPLAAVLVAVTTWGAEAPALMSRKIGQKLPFVVTASVRTSVPPVVDGKLDDVLNDLRVECRPDRLAVYTDMAVIATVGRGMAHTPGMAAKLFGALGEAQVNVRMIDQGSSEINIIVGVESEDFEKAVCAIYQAFGR